MNSYLVNDKLLVRSNDIGVKITCQFSLDKVPEVIVAFLGFKGKCLA